MTRVKPALAVGMATAALLALPLGAFARHPDGPGQGPAGIQQVKGTQFGGAGTLPSSLSTLTAGTVTSFENDVLTVTLNDGQVLTGNIDPRTRIVCGTPPRVWPRSGLSPASSPPSGTTGVTGPEGPAHRAPGPRIRPCGPEALTPGTPIHAVGLMAEPRGVHYVGLALIKLVP